VAAQTILWVALPNGLVRRDGTLMAKLSVFVSPRLQGASTLAPFDFLDWPARLQPGRAEFQVAFADRSVRADIKSQSDSQLWRALFSESTFVRSPASSPLSRIYSSYPAARVHDVLKSAYQNISANSPLRGPAAQVLGAAFADFHAAFAPDGGPVGAPTASDRERRLRLANDLFRPGAAQPLNQRLDQLVDLATHEVRQAASADADLVPLVPDSGTVTNGFAQLIAFHKQARGSAPSPVGAASDTQLDFHQLLAALGDYYGLLRQLGLVIDLEFPAAQIPPSAPSGPNLLSVAPRFVPPLSVATPPPRTPATAYEFAPATNRFRAALGPAGIAAGEFVDGLLNLQLRAPGSAGAPQFRIIQFDVDGAALGTVDLLGRVARAPAGGLGGQQGDFGLAPLRSNGLSVVHSDGAQLLLKAIAAGRQKLDRISAGESVPLFAEDLVRGFRIDIRDQTSGKWHSLHQRDGTYTFLRVPRDVKVSEENCIQPSIVQPMPDPSRPAPSTHDPAAPNYISESLFLWQGWSVAVPRPGEKLPQKASPSPPPGLDLTTRFTVPHKSLPRLRFGESYQVRARTADLAGNGLNIDDADAVATAPVLPGPRDRFPFLRFEPVSSPLPVFRAPRPSGGRVERIVLRSSLAANPETFAAQHPEYRNAGERHIAPPKTSQWLAETSGLFDASIGTGADTDRTFKLAQRESGSLADGATPPASGSDDPIHPEPQLVLTYLPDPLAAGAAFRNLPGVASGQVVRAQAAGFQSASLSSLGDAAKDVASLTLVDFGPSSRWPDLTPFRLRLAEGTAAPAWDASQRVLTIFLPKGESRTVEMACYLGGETELNRLGIWGWLTESLQLQQQGGAITEAQRAARLASFQQLSLFGLSRMLTPARKLTLVHALEQPLQPPVLSPPQPIKIPGATFAYLKGRVTVHAATTGQLDLVARWTEKVEDMRSPPQEASFEKHVLTFALHGEDDIAAAGTPSKDGPFPVAKFDAATGTVDFVAPNLQAMRDDLRRAGNDLVNTTDDFVQAARMVRPPDPGLVQQTSRVRDEARSLMARIALPPWPDIPDAARNIGADARFDPDAPPHFGHVPDDVKDAGFKVGSAAEDLASSAEQGNQSLERYQARHEFGDTKHRLVRYQAVSTTRFRDDFPADDAGVFSSDSAEQTANILSGAPPAAPKVRYVIPTFGSRAAGGASPGVLVRQRLGGGLRVYLDRPWYSSGEGELLGVIVASAPDTLQGANVTQWGRDPIWESGHPAASPAVANFTRAVRTQSGLVAPGAPPNITVVGHRVDFDSARDLYFSDIEIAETESYFPFVRLALARYQPDSMDGMHLSRAVLADFAQLAPNRTVTLTPAPDSRDRFTVKVEGLTYRSNSWKRGDVDGDVDFERPPPGPSTAFQVNPGVPLIDISVQQRIPGTSDAAGWLPAAAAQGIGIRATSLIIAGFNVDPGAPLWLGQVTLPGNRAPGQFRIVIREFERLVTGFPFKNSVLVPGDPNPDGPHHTTVGDTAGTVVSFNGAGRLVFADAIEL
jgi:hypothetical protein